MNKLPIKSTKIDDKRNYMLESTATTTIIIRVYNVPYSGNDFKIFWLDL